MPPAPHRRAVSVPDAAFYATEATAMVREESLMPPQGKVFPERANSFHSRQVSPTSVLAAAELDQVVFPIPEEQGDEHYEQQDEEGAEREFQREAEDEDDRRYYRCDRDRHVVFMLPSDDGSQHPLLRDGGAAAMEDHPLRSSRAAATTDLLPASPSCRVLRQPDPSSRHRRHHRRSQTDPSADRLLFSLPRGDAEYSSSSLRQRIEEEEEDSDSALEDLHRCLSSLLSTLGPSHPRVGLLYNRIGTYHFRRGDFAGAESAYHEALRAFRDAYGAGHAGSSGSSLRSCGSSSSSMESFGVGGARPRRRRRGRSRRSSSSSSSSAGHDIKGSYAVASALGNVGAVHWRTGRVRSAVAYLEEALRVYEGVDRRVRRTTKRRDGGGDDGNDASSSSTFSSDSNREEDMANEGQDGPSSRKNKNEVEEGKEEEGAGEDRGSAEMAHTLHNLGVAYTLRGSSSSGSEGGNGKCCGKNRHLRLAKRALLRSLSLFEVHSGPYHVDVARVQDALGRLYALRGKPRRALEYHESALRIKSAILNARDPSLVRSMMKVAACHRALGQLEEAEEVLGEVLDGQNVALLRSADAEYRSSMMTLVGRTMRMIGEVQRERIEREAAADAAVAFSSSSEEDADEGDEVEDEDDVCTLTFSVTEDEREDD